MKQFLAVIAILMIIFGFGMIHGTSRLMEIVSILMIGLGAAYLLFLVLKYSGKNPPDSE